MAVVFVVWLCYDAGYNSSVISNSKVLQHMFVITFTAAFNNKICTVILSDNIFFLFIVSNLSSFSCKVLFVI